MGLLSSLSFLEALEFRGELLEWQLRPIFFCSSYLFSQFSECRTIVEVGADEQKEKDERDGGEEGLVGFVVFSSWTVLGWILGC